MNQHDISDPKETLDIARILRRFVAEQLATGRPAIPESDADEFLDKKFPYCPIEERRLIVRNEFDRLERAAVIKTA